VKCNFTRYREIRGKMACDKDVIHMKKETKTVVYDDELRFEAYCFEGGV